MTVVVLAALLPVGVAAQDQQAKIFGTVLSPDGKRVAGVEVRVIHGDIAGLPRVLGTWLERPVVVGTRTRTDGRGRFTLPFHTSTACGVVAKTTDGKLVSGIVAPVAPFQSVELRLCPLLSVRGRAVVSRDGVAHPLSGVLVRCRAAVVSGVRSRPWGFSELGVLHEVRTATDGSFEVKVPQGLDCKVELEHGLGATAVRLDKPAKPDSKPLELRYSTQCVIGTIESAATGKPLANALVMVNPSGDSTRCDATGRFVLNVPAERYLIVEAPGHAVTYARGTATFEPRKLVIPAAHRVHGRLLAADGKPLAGVEIVVVRLATGEAGSGIGLTVQKTGKDGSFELWGRSKKSGLVAWVRLGNRYLRFANSVAGVGDVDLGAVRLDPVPLQGVVLDPDGTPAAHLPVHVQPESDPFGSRFALGQFVAAFTNHAGRFTVHGLLPDSYLVVARSPTSFPYIEKVKVQPDTKPMTIRLKRAPDIVGRVVDDTGKAMPGVIVTASAYRGIDKRLRKVGIWWSDTWTDAEGRFTLAAVQADLEHVVKASHPGWQTDAAPKVQPGTTDVEVVVSRRQ